MTLVTRLTGAMVGLAALTAGLIGIFVYRDLEETVLPVEMRRLEGDTRLLADHLADHAEGARADVLSLRGSASVDGLVRARRAGGRDPVTGLTDAQHEDQFAQLLSAVLAAKPAYVKARLIGLDDGGREIVRVDRSGLDGAIRRVPRDQLQRKGVRDFVNETARLASGEVYVSDIDLNVEQGRIELPAVPVLRTATPVHAADGTPFGLVILNVDMRPVFRELRQRRLPQTRLFVVNGRGDYLLHPAPQNEFAFEFGQPRRVQEDIPDLDLDPQGGAATSITTLGGSRIGLAIASVSLAEGPRISVIQAQSYPHIVRAVRAIRDSALLAGVVAALIAALAGVILARSLARPIIQMTTAVTALQSGRSVTLPVEIAGEVGVLARAFQHYTLRERMFGAALDSSEDAVIATTLDGVITGWNPAAERLYGYTAEEAIGAPARMLIQPGNETSLEQNLERIREGHGFQDMDVVHVARDGARLLLEARVSAVRGPSGELIGSLAILSDVAEKRQLEAKFRLAFEASPSGMIMVDARGVIALVNHQVERMFGYRADELVGHPVHGLVPLRFRERHPLDLDAFAAAPSARAMGEGRDLFGLRRDGSEFPVEITLQPVETAGGLLVLGVILDITERQKAAAALAAKTRELERSNAELEQFAYVASHDLREPLRMVASYTELLAERYGGSLDERADKYIGYIVDGAKRMQRLVSDLLTLSRVGTQGKSFEPTDTAAVVRHVCRSMGDTIRRQQAQIEHGDLPIVSADEGQLGQLFQNLIGNALKFHAPDRAPRITIEAVRDGANWIFSVGDNGIGIDAQYSERIFQMFQRLHARDEYEGNGIGLAIAKKIVERHGGTIRFDSRVGEGTTFYFTLLAHGIGDRS
jgi:PAS domain S-box-containing protein